MGPCTVYEGDVLDGLAQMPDASVHCCVTSPPYWGLRDYGVEGQMGLEPSPDAYVAGMVAVFREVRRVLRDDGTLFLNCGDSYYGATRGSGGKSPKQLTNAGSFFDDKQSSQSRADARSCGSDGKEQSDSQDADRVCPDCGGELTIGYPNRRRRTSGTSQHRAQSERRGEMKGRDNERLAFETTSRLGDFPDFLHQPTTASSCGNAPGACDPKATASPFQSGRPTLPCDEQQSAHSSACTGDTAQSDHPSDCHTSDTVLFCKACGYCTITHPPLKPKDLCGIPWRLALALQADGWWLRSVIVWHKRSPMPESVTDRPTSAWEPIFLLAKRERYFYDADAVKQKATAEPHAPGYVNGEQYAVGPMDRGGHSQREQPDRVWGAGGGANLRNVWTLSSEPYKAAHFATFPRTIPERCIKAGTSAKGVCAECGAPWERITETVKPPTRAVNGTGPHGEHGLLGGARFDEPIKTTTTGWQPTCKCNAGEPVPATVLDPFGGSGTTGEVALGLSRRAILCELNPAYVELIRERICGQMPLLTATNNAPGGQGEQL
jgi:DNA modification methylase